MLNIFTQTSLHINEIHTQLVADGVLAQATDLSKMVVELPRDMSHGDLSTNVAMVTAKQAGMKPRDLAACYAERLESFEIVQSVEIAGPGLLTSDWLMAYGKTNWLRFTNWCQLWSINNGAEDRILMLNLCLLIQRDLFTRPMLEGQFLATVYQIC